MKQLKLFKYGFSVFICTLVFIVISLILGIRLVFHIYPYLLIISSVFAFASMAISTNENNKLIATAKFISYFFFLGSFFLFFWPRDLLFGHIGMASHLEYEEPIKLDKTQIDSITQTNPSRPYFKLTGSFGTYTAIINTNINESGIFYLRVFDAKGNIELSPDRIPERTETRIKETGPQTFQLSFTQYDGVWQHFFIGRVELWYKPTSKEKGKKLLQKNFKIDGWIR